MAKNKSISKKRKHEKSVKEMIKIAKEESKKEEKKVSKKDKVLRKKIKAESKKELAETMKLKTKRDIAMDFAEKVVRKFDTLIKAVVLFGSTAKNTPTVGSDIDIIIIVDDATIKFDQKFVMWYREELGDIVSTNPYREDLHINTVKVTTWWNDLMLGDPTVINVLRYGEPLIDVGGFFVPLKVMLQDGRIKPTPEAIYTVINRVPSHILRSRVSEMSAVEGCYWAFVESAQGLLMAIDVMPPSPEHIPELLTEHFVSKGFLKKNSVKDYMEIFDIHKKIIHGEIKNIDGKLVDEYQVKSEEFFKKTVNILNQILGA